MSTSSRSSRFAAFIVSAMSCPLVVLASVPPEEQGFEEVVVTGLRVGQGGAQDIKFFRGEVEFERIPHPDDLTAEGLMSEHDIVFPSAEPCAQLFCLTGDVTTADLLAAPHARHLAGIGFATNIDEKSWRRDPVNLVAVVDKSGSMDGEPLDLVRKSLGVMARQLRRNDQMSIVLYGDTAYVHLPATRANDEGLATILAAIHGIRSDGATSMEAGLRVGYDVAFETAPAFRGRTRLILFTDERPNTDATDAESFMGMAEAASRAGVGLTTVGVGVQFDAALATRIGSVRGGNLYFIRDETDVKDLFTGQLEYMVSELAHDLRLTLTPHPGLRISGVYGVPGELLGWQNGSQIQVTIPTVFLDNHGGAIFVALAPETSDSFLPERPRGEPLLRAEVSYLPYGGRNHERHAIAVAAQPGGASEGMRLGHLLIDEFTVLREATSAHHVRHDQETAWRVLDRFKQRLDGSPLAGLDDERKLVDSLHTRLTFLSGHGGEVPTNADFARLWGRWIVERTRGEVEFADGQVLEFTADNELHIVGASPGYRSGKSREEYQSNHKQIYLPESDQVYRYKIRGDELTLRDGHGFVQLRRESREPDSPG